LEPGVIPSIETIPQEVVRRLIGVFFDIDDTFTTRGKIPAASFDALWKLKDAGIKLVPITGRPGGWCDHIVRMWPVDGVVGENGAFYFWMDEHEGKLKKRFLDPEDVRKKNRGRLGGIRDEILSAVPGCAVASDQSYRETDLAIDFREDVPPLGWDDIERDRFFFCGDSPNDEPMFSYFPHTAGVRNVLLFAGRMKHLPAFIADSEGGEGFAEIAVILARHGQQTLGRREEDQ